MNLENNGWNQLEIFINDNLTDRQAYKALKYLISVSTHIKDDDLYALIKQSIDYAIKGVEKRV